MISLEPSNMIDLKQWDEAIEFALLHAFFQAMDVAYTDQR